jgi:hypothetical protein
MNEKQSGGRANIGTSSLILIFIIRKLADNFYRIKRKFMMHHKVKTPYKEIKKNKRFGRKNR